MLFRINYLHNKQEAASLELLGSPEMLGIAESLAGPNFVPTYESLVFKNTGDGAPIDWHQDAVHPRNFRIFNVDVYLDESRKGAGSLRVAPGSHKQIVDVCQLQEEFGWDAEQIMAEGPWGPEFIDQRLRLIALGRAEWQRRNPGDEAFEWNVSGEFEPAISGDEAEELRVAHGVHSPGSYCSAGSVATKPSGRPV